MKRIKMLLYGEPGVGKSVFASKAPKPHFICTDGNYEWLEDFGADPDACTNVTSWSEMKKAFKQNFDNVETVVVDLLEDAFKWCEQEYCIRNKIEHVSDVGYGKAYDATRNEFFIEVSKLLAMDKHVILICHSITFTTKDRRGVEHTKHAPSSRIPDKVLDMIEGRVRYCLRCYASAEEQLDGTIVKKRFLSLVPKENEFGIIRGVDENLMPHDIPLDFEIFASAIGIDTKAESKPAKVTKQKAETKVEKTVEVKAETKAETSTSTAEVETVAPVTDMKSKLAALKAKRQAMSEQAVETTSVENVVTTSEEEIPEEVVEEATKQVDIKVDETAPYVEVEKPVEKTVEKTEVVTVSTSDKLDAIKAKLAAMKAKK